MLVYFWCSVQ